MLNTHAQVELLLGFPAAPFIVALATRDKAAFLGYASAYPSHPVRLRRTGQAEQAEWIATPVSDPDRYQLSFTLPQRLEAWISSAEQYERRRIRQVKTEFLSAIMVYYVQDGGVRACQLTYEPSQLRRS